MRIEANNLAQVGQKEMLQMALIFGDREKAKDLHKQWLERKDTVAPPLTKRRPEPRCACGMGFCKGDCEAALELETLEGENDYVERNLE